jgi:hypothetical protein
MSWNMGFSKYVAPPELIRQDLRILKSYTRLHTTEKIQQLLFMQSVEGRSHNGHGAFSKRTYVNTTIDDIVRAMKYSPREVKKARQVLIDDIVKFVDDTLSDQPRDRLVNESGEPFLGIPFFKDLKVNARDIVRGIYMGGLRDNVEVRKEAEKIYQTKIGGGQCYRIDIRKMDEMGLDGEKLAHEPHEDEIADFIKEGLILQEGADDGPNEDQVRFYYVRHRLGPGQSDDAAMVVAGILYNQDVALGVFIADAIDTLEKYAPFFKDQDQELSYYIARGFKDLKITMEDVYEVTYLSAIPERDEEFVPDSSLRYLISIDQITNRTALDAHLAFIQGKPVPEMSLSYKRILTSQFYSYIKKRLLNVRRIDRLTVPDLKFEELARPVEEIVHKNFIVVSKETPLSQVVKEFKDTKSEIVIVVNKRNKVVGTLSAADLINMVR